MKLNLKVKYGIGCIFELSKCAGEYLDAQALAQKQNIPPAYAQKILQTLMRAGLVFSQKGVGYKLARSLETITALDVMNALSTDETHAATSVDAFEQRVSQALDSVTLSEVFSSTR